MKIVILTPGIKDKKEVVRLKDFQDVDLFFLTNPVYQESMLTDAAGGQIPKPCITEEGLLGDALGETINQKAKAMAQDWPQVSEMVEALTFEGINLGMINTRLFTYYLVGLLKARRLYCELLERYRPSEIILFADGTYWAQVVRSLAESKGIRVSIPYVRETARDVYETKGSLGQKEGRRFTAAASIRTLLSQWNHFFVRGYRRSAVIVSAAPRYARPFLKKEKHAVYLREIFSVKGFFECSQYRNRHVIPGYFGGKNKMSKEDNQTRARIISSVENMQDAAGIFEDEGESILPFVRAYLTEIFRAEVQQWMGWIKSFNRMLDEIKPYGVVVDEDVCAFNKTFVFCANRREVPTYVLMHGIPYFDIGTIPASAKYILCWGQSSKKRIREWGIEENRIFEFGAPQYIDIFGTKPGFSRQEIIKRLKIPKTQKIILFAAFPFRTNERPDFIGSPLRPEALSRMLAILVDYLKTNEGVSLIIKLHPADKNIWFAKELVKKMAGFERLTLERIRIIHAGDIQALIQASDLTLTFVSTVYLEALLLGKPVYTFDFGSERHAGIFSDEFIDVEDVEACGRQMTHNLTDARLRERKKNQTYELEKHFFNRNQKAEQTLDDFLKEINSARQIA